MCGFRLSRLVVSSLAGSLPDDLLLDDRLGELSSGESTLPQRREGESRDWESDAEETPMDQTTGQQSSDEKEKAHAAAAGARAHAPSVAPILVVPPAALAALNGDETAAADLNLADPAVAGSLTPDQKHRVFEKKRDANYKKMGNLLHKHHPDEEEDEDA